MLAFRYLARAVPRASSQLTARSASKQLPRLRILSSTTTLPAFSLASRNIAPFSSSSRQLQDDDALAVKLAQEIKIESDLRSNAEKDPGDGIENLSPPNEFELNDVPGQEEVILTRKYNNEIIRVVFNIADINNEHMPSEAEEDFDPEVELENEPLANQRSKPQSTTRVAPEDQIEENEVENYNESDSESFPIKLEITITKDGKPGALCVDSLAQDGDLIIENFFYFKDTSLPQPATFEAEKKRGIAYAGPPFGNLDEELQSLLERYLADRGVNALLAEYISHYIDAKEQKEYVNWLNSVKEFVE